MSYNVLNIMDVAYATIKYGRDDQYIQCTYMNNAMELLIGIDKKKCVNRMIYKDDQYIDGDWLDCYEKVTQEQRILHYCKYDQKLQKHIEVKIFPICQDILTFGLIIEDVTSSYHSLLEISRLSKINEKILKRSGTIALIVDMRTKQMTNTCQDLLNFKYHVDNLSYPDGLIAAGLVKEKYRQIMEDVLNQQNHQNNPLIEIRRDTNEQYHWCELIEDIIEYDQGLPIQMLCIFRNVDMIAQQNKLLVSKNSIDALTLVYNREGFYKKIQKIYERNDQGQNALFMIDLDNFKTVNDEKGHDYGDLVLQQFAHILRMTFRKDDIISRFGGDEFCVFVHQIDKTDAIELCERLFLSHGMKYMKSLGISASIGVVIAKGTHHYNDIFLQADETMYNVKKHLKDGYEIRELFHN